MTFRRSMSTRGAMPGFDEAQRIMTKYEARSQLWLDFRETTLLQDACITAVHVNNTDRADRVILTACDANGHILYGETFYCDEPGMMQVVAEFDHDFTNMAVTPESDLTALISDETGWVVDLMALREYDLYEDQRTTQRAAFIAHMADMTHRNEVHVIGKMGDIDGNQAA